ncbi:hypothetical protein [Henriciella aquimarina]|uniref:hypothetical protein n=1 Tax=Henriciella aquimarina TaxID=545261 RepID=UPI00117B593F|nr:hypothetical protein [Henriciella aquimarina]
MYDEELVPLLAMICILPTVLYFLAAFVSGHFRLGRWVFLSLFAVGSLNFLTEDGGYPLYWVGSMLVSSAYWLIAMRWRSEPVYLPDRPRPTQVSYVGAWLISGFLAGVAYAAIGTVDTRYYYPSELLALFLFGLTLNIAASLIVYSMFSQLRLYLVMPYLWGLGLVGVVLASAVVLGRDELNDPTLAGYAAAESLIVLVVHNLAFYFFFKSKGRMRRQIEHLGSALSDRDKRNAVKAFE